MYLVTIDGDVLEVDWARLIESLITGPAERLAFELSFIDARYLYARDWERLVRDPDIGDLLRAKVDRLAEIELEVGQQQLDDAGATWHPAGLPQTMADMEIHRGVIYTVSESGLETVARHDLRAGRQKHWDGQPARLRASRGGMLAIAAGPDGLRQAPTRRWNEQLAEPWEVLRGNFTGCNWLNSSIYGSSHVNAGALAVFSQAEEHHAGRPRRRIRTFEAAFDDREIFDEAERAKLDSKLRDDPHRKTHRDAEQDPDIPETADELEPVLTHFETHYDQAPEVTERSTGFSWAGQDRICLADANSVHMVRYSPRAKRYSTRIHPLEDHALKAGADVRGGDVAPFGVVVETDDDLLVLTSNGVKPLGITPVRWRTYPRATNYPNHLHVIGEDRVRIISFLNEDMRHYARGRPGGGFVGRARRA